MDNVKKKEQVLTYLSLTLSLKDKIGNTPIIRLNYLSDTHGVNLYGKCEFMNPSGSVKDRAAYAMIHDALDGVINGKTHIIEPTSGNTGIALAFICASLGLKLTLTMPESMSVERRQLLKAYGANLDLTPAHLGMSVLLQGQLNWLVKIRLFLNSLKTNPIQICITEQLVLKF